LRQFEHHLHLDTGPEHGGQIQRPAVGNLHVTAQQASDRFDHTHALHHGAVGESLLETDDRVAPCTTQRHHARLHLVGLRQAQGFRVTPLRHGPMFPRRAVQIQGQ